MTSPSTTAPRAPASQGGSILEAVEVSKSFGGVHAVRSVNFHVRKGEIVGLVGPNGSGKSTLLNGLSRADTIDSGSITFDGTDITQLRAMHVARRGMARTFQSVRIFPELTVLENALLGRQWKGVGIRGLVRPADVSTHERARALLDLMNITELSQLYAGNISGGQMRLLELVMAMMARPQLVMLDEATSGVNPTLIESLKHYVQLLNREEGVAFVIVEHNIGFIFPIAERIVVLNDGQVLADGRPDEIRQNQEVVDAYLGA